MPSPKNPDVHKFLWNGAECWDKGTVRVNLNRLQQATFGSIEFSDINYWVGKAEESHILKGVSGYVPGGKMLGMCKV